MKEQLRGIHQWIKDELDRCVRFWLDNGMDSEYGGVYTCLDRQGRVFSTDKSVWMQGRCAWTFSKLCNQYGEKPEWRTAAESCLDFMEKYCINRDRATACSSPSPRTASPCASAATISPKASTPWPTPNIIF